MKITKEGKIILDDRGLEWHTYKKKKKKVQTFNSKKFSKTQEPKNFKK